ncbi:MAG: hypothetical protein QOD07_966 [Frankiaceae bacterium]|jgi:hypothetical protein|nr:hypothetical protein [Frankiaceae bacterium]
MDLIIRAGRDDHRVIAELSAPATTGLRLARAVPFTAIVADAPVAAARPELRETAESAALPFLVDPMTFLLADVQPPAHAWARLPFAGAEALRPADLAHGDVQDELVERVIMFQREQGATLLIPPYVYMGKRDDGWLPVQLSLLRRTARYLERENVDLPVAAIFAASLRQFGPQAQWREGLDAFIARSQELNTRFVGLSLSWSEQGKDSYDTLAMLLTVTRHAAGRAPVIAWRQGLYGAALTAAGAQGYETGPGHSERGMYPTLMSDRRPRPPRPDDDGPNGFGVANVYLGPLGRSLRRADARVLLEDMPMRARLLCQDDACCPDGAGSMVTDWRQHATRARASQLADLARMPQSSWRLNQIARDAERAALIARDASEVLHRGGRDVTVPHASFEHLAAVADAVRAEAGSDVA